MVIVPILTGAVGKYSVFAMSPVCAVVYAVGSVIRFNIKNAEPILASDQAPKKAKTLVLDLVEVLSLLIV